MYTNAGWKEHGVQVVARTGSTRLFDSEVLRPTTCDEYCVEVVKELQFQVPRSFMCSLFWYDLQREGNKEFFWRNLVVDDMASGHLHDTQAQS